MNRKNIISVATGTALGMAILAVTNVTQAFDMGNMMNPGEWFDNNNDRYRHGRGTGAMYPTAKGAGPIVGVAIPFMVVMVVMVVMVSRVPLL